jgi:hypothetical protein
MAFLFKIATQCFMVTSLYKDIDICMEMYMYI